LNLAWLRTKASQTFSGTFSGTISGTFSMNPVEPDLALVERDLALHQSLQDLVRNLLRNLLRNPVERDLAWLCTKTSLIFDSHPTET
jgi:hypothetical protein